MGPSQRNGVQLTLARLGVPDKTNGCLFDLNVVSVTSDPLLLIPSRVLAHAVVRLACSGQYGKSRVNTCALSRMGVGGMNVAEMASPCLLFVCDGVLDWPLQTPSPKLG